jgi:glycerol kinase
MAAFVLALDQGTTSSRSIVYDEAGRAVASSQLELPQIYPRPGWVEHDPEAIWSTQIETARQALQQAGLAPRDIAAIGITNQRETTVLWDRRTGKPIHNAIVWQCRRTAPMCERLKANGLGEEVQRRTGLVIDAYFSATKIAWLLENVDGARRLAEQGAWHSGRRYFPSVALTDGACRYRRLQCIAMLFNLATLSWDPWLLDQMDSSRFSPRSGAPAGCWARPSPTPWARRYLWPGSPATNRRHSLGNPVFAPEWRRTPMARGVSFFSTPGARRYPPQAAC